MAPKSDNNNWQYFFTSLLTVIIILQGYNIRKQEATAEKDNNQDTAIINLRYHDSRTDERCKTCDDRFKVYDDRFKNLESQIDKDELNPLQKPR